VAHINSLKPQQQRHYCLLPLQAQEIVCLGLVHSPLPAPAPLGKQFKGVCWAPLANATVRVAKAQWHQRVGPGCAVWGCCTGRSSRHFRMVGVKVVEPANNMGEVDQLPVPTECHTVSANNREADNVRKGE